MPKPPRWMSRVSHAITDPLVGFTHWTAEKARPAFGVAQTLGSLAKQSFSDTLEDPLGTYAKEYLPGMGFGLLQGAARVAGAAMPGVRTEGLQEAIGEHIPQTPTGLLTGMVGGLGAEFTTAADVASIGYTKDAIDAYNRGEVGKGTVLLEALGVLPFVPSLAHAGRRIAGPALLNAAGEIIHDAPKAVTHADVFGEAVSGGLLKADDWLPESSKGFIDQKGHWMTREEATSVAEEGGQFTGRELSPEEADWMQRHEIQRGLLSEEVGDFAPLDAADEVEDVVPSGPTLEQMRADRGKKVQSFRHLDEETAHAAAAEGLHLREIRSAESGRIAGYHGAPPTVKSSQGLNAWRKDFAAMVARGAEYGRFWYDEAREGTQEATRLLPDEETTKFALSQGVMSSGAEPPIQHGFAMQGWNQYSRDEPISAGRWPTAQSERMRMVMEEGATDIGPKTGPYGVTMNPRKPMPWIPVTDMWVMRGLGYTTEVPTEAQRAFIDGEMLRMVQRMNASLPEGARKFTVPEVQASMWTYLKGNDLLKRKKVRTLEEGMQEAAKSHAHFLDRTVMNMTRETVPGAAGHLEGAKADEGIKNFLAANDPFMVGHPATGRQDILTREAGLLQRDAIPFQGEWEGEFNPGTNVRVLGDKPKGGGGFLSPEFMEQVQGTEMYRGLIQGQQSVAGHRVAAGADTAEQLGVHIPMTGKATPEQMIALRAASKPSGLFPVDTGEGINLLNDLFADVQLSPQEIQQGLIQSTEPDLFGGSLGDMILRETGSEGVRRAHQGFYREVYEGTVPGQGEATRRTLEQIDKTPGLARRLEQSEAMKTVAGMQKELNEAVSEMGFGPARDDIQRMLDILSKEGLLGLRKALDKGVALPLFAGLGLGLANRERRREGGLLNY